MERDYNVVRKILLAIENNEGNDNYSREIDELGLTDIDEKVYYYHTRLMTKDGLIESEEERNIAIDDVYYKPICLTNKGHDFLDHIKDNNLWNKLVKFSGETIKTMTPALLIETAKKLMG